MNDSLLYITLVILLIFITSLMVIMSRLKSKYPYYKNPYFISLAERTFFNALLEVVNNEYFIFPQVSLNSLLKIDLKGKDYWTYINKIKQKSVDFVLVNRNNFDPLLVIELDDTSHFLKSRRIRDDFLEDSLTSAKIKYLRIKTQPSYNISELKEAILNKISEV